MDRILAIDSRGVQDGGLAKIPPEKIFLGNTPLSGEAGPLLPIRRAGQIIKFLGKFRGFFGFNHDS